MRVREIGEGGPSVAVAGCGDVSLPRAARRGLDSSEVTRALHAAIEFGLGLIDVADDPDSVKLVGDAVRVLRARDRVVVATTITPRTQGTSPTAEGAGGRWRPGIDALAQALPAHHVIERVDSALRASRLEAIPLAQLPLAPEFRDGSAWAELTGTCAQLVRDGKVLRWGAIIDDVSDADAAARLADGGWLASAQVSFSACTRGAGALIDKLAARKVSVLARHVMAGGALAGTLGPSVKLPLGDDRRTIDDATLVRLAVGAAELAALVSHEPPAARSCTPARARLDTIRERRPAMVECKTLAELALRYAIDRAGVTCALVRLHRHAHVLDAAAAAGASPLSADLMKRLEALDI